MCIAIAGVAVAVMVMEFTLAVVTGFNHEIERKLMGFDSEIVLLPPYIAGNTEQQPIIQSDTVLYSILSATLSEEAELSQAIRQPGILKDDNDFEGVIFEARGARAAFDFERSNITVGEWPHYDADSTVYDIVISEVLASRLLLDVGSKIYSTFIVDGNIKLRRNTVAALYKSDFGEYDKKVVYCSMDMLRGILAIDSLCCTRIEIRGLDPEAIDATGTDIQEQLHYAAAAGIVDGYYPVSTIHQSGALYFNWLALLDTNVVVIFILMLCVAALTLISSLFILILERVRTIGILRAMGTTRLAVRNIFVFMALKVVGAGLIIGNIIGVGLLLAQRTWHIVPLNPDMYYLDSVPVQINPVAFVALNIGVVVASWLILILPASLAARVDPAEAAKFD